MRTVAGTRGVRKGIRSLLQTIAGGGLTALVAAIAGGLDPTIAGLLIAAFGALVAFLQNYLETKGTIPTFLPTPGQVVTEPVDAVVGTGVGTVDAVVDQAGDIAGEVVDTAGEVVGDVTGTVSDTVKDVLDVEDTLDVSGGVIGDLLGGAQEEEKPKTTRRTRRRKAQ